MALLLNQSTSADHSSSPSPLSWTNTGAGSPRAVVVHVRYQGTLTQSFVNCTYGGVSMAQVGSAGKATGEGGHVVTFFLGSGVPSGDQDVVVSYDSAVTMAATVVTYTADSDCAVRVIDDTSINSDSLADPSLVLALESAVCGVSLGFTSGFPGVTGITPLSGWTSRSEVDFGPNLGACYTYDTIGRDDVTCGWTQVADDAVAVAVAVYEEGQILFDAFGEASTAFANPQTFSIDISPDASAVYVVVCGDPTPAVPTSISVGTDSVSTTPVHTSGTDSRAQRMSIFELINPTVSGVQTVSIGFSGDETPRMYAFSLTGDIDSVSPSENFTDTHQTGFSSSITGASVSSEVDDLVLSIVNINANSDQDISSDQVDHASDLILGTSTSAAVASALGAASVSVDWSWAGGVSRGTSVTWNVNRASAVATPVDIEVPVGTLSFTGLVPIVVAADNTIVEVPLQTISIAGLAPEVVIPLIFFSSEPAITDITDTGMTVRATANRNDS